MTLTRIVPLARPLALVVALATAAPLARVEAQQRTAVPAAAMPDGAFASVDWRTLAGLDYENGKVSDTLKKLDGQHVRVPGFIVPLDDADTDGAEFLLVPYYGACVHTPPPPPNQMAFVQMVGNKSVKLGLFDAVWLEGTLRITNYDSPYGQVGFKIEGINMKPYTGR